MYVLYTSGSTGQPKGVRVLQRGVVNLLCSMAAQPGVSASDVLLAVTTLSFDIACLELFLPLLVGAKVVIASRETARDGVKLAAALNHGVTVLQGTRATWRLLLQSGWSGTPGLKMLCGGEALSPELARQILERGESLWNLYGPTETTIYSTAQKIEAADTKITIGRPIANTRVYIVDHALQPVPVGEVGELLIGGDGVAGGYVNQPELTATKFLNDPFLPGARVFRTGDRGCFLADGRIDLLGRMDHQVKIHGYRIELGEIGATLASHPAVQTAVATAHDVDQGHKVLIGYFVPKADAAPTVVELRGHLKTKLPAYMVPSVLVPLARLPLTPSGKIDRKALPLPDFTRRDRPGSASPGVPDREGLLPKDALEMQLAHIWEKLLGIRSIGVRDDFFDLGGDSLVAARLFAEIQKVCGHRLSLATLLQAPTIEKLAQKLRTNDQSARWSSLVTLQVGHGTPPLYLIHPVGGNVMGFRPLMRYFPQDQAIYALQSLGLDGRRPPLTSIEDMASHYLAEIRGVQSQGPYLLIGNSFGGLVAYEMAQLLHGQGEKLGLAMLDTAGPRYFKRFIPRSWDHVRHFCRLGFREKTQYLLERAGNFKMRISVATRRRHQPVVSGKTLFATLQEVEAANYVAEQRYRPRQYSGAATLFRAMKQPVGTYDDPSLGWDQLVAGGLQVYNVPGDHLSMTDEPHVRLLAAHVQSFIHRVLERA